MNFRFEPRREAALRKHKQLKSFKTEARRSLASLAINTIIKNVRSEKNEKAEKN